MTHIDKRPTNPKCRAHSKRTGQPCGRHAMPGTAVCHMHGGKAPQVQAKAQIRLTLAQAFEWGDRRPAWQILADALHTADTLMLDARTKLTDQGEPVTAADLDLFLQALDRAQRFAKTVLDAGVDERRARVAEEQAALLAGVIRNILDDLDLSREQQARVGEVVPRHLRTLAA